MLFQNFRFSQKMLFQTFRFSVPPNHIVFARVISWRRPFVSVQLQNK